LQKTAPQRFCQKPIKILLKLKIGGFLSRSIAGTQYFDLAFDRQDEEPFRRNRPDNSSNYP
jgi:hypothetical protein